MNQGKTTGNGTGDDVSYFFESLLQDLHEWAGKMSEVFESHDGAPVRGNSMRRSILWSASSWIVGSCRWLVPGSLPPGTRWPVRRGTWPGGRGRPGSACSCPPLNRPARRIRDANGSASPWNRAKDIDPRATLVSGSGRVIVSADPQLAAGALLVRGWQGSDAASLPVVDKDLGFGEVAVGRCGTLPLAIAVPA